MAPPIITCRKRSAGIHEKSFFEERRGFTLVELMVVLCLLIVLAFFLISSITGVVEKSRATACLANLRTMGQATTLFFGERNWSKVLVNSDSDKWEWWKGHSDQDPHSGLAEYIPNLNQLYCKTLKKVNNPKDAPYYVSSSGLQYANDANVSKKYRNLRELPSLSEVAAFMDGGRGNRAKPGSGALRMSQPDYAKYDNAGGALAYPHWPAPADPYNVTLENMALGQMNVVFLDGHVQSIDRGNNRPKGNFWGSKP